MAARTIQMMRSEEHTSELQSLRHLVCRLLLEKNKLNLAHSISCICWPGDLRAALSQCQCTRERPPAARCTIEASMPPHYTKIFFFYDDGTPKTHPFSPARRSPN